MAILDDVKLEVEQINKCVYFTRWGEISSFMGGSRGVDMEGVPGKSQVAKY